MFSKVTELLTKIALRQPNISFGKLISMIQRNFYSITIFLVSYILRFIGIFSINLTMWDEMIYIEAGKQYVEGLLLGNWNNFNVNNEHPMLGKWIFGFASHFLPSFLPYSDLICARLVTILFSSCTCVLIFYIGKELADEKFGFISAILLSLNGFFFFMSINCMLDTILTFFLTLSIYLYLKERYLLCGIATSMALATKYSALFIPLIFFILMSLKNLSFHHRDNIINFIIKKRKKKEILRLLILLIISVIVFFAIQPRLWTDPLQRLIESLEKSRGHFKIGHNVWFMGSVRMFTPPSFFLLQLLCHSSIIETIGIVLFCIYIFRKGLTRRFQTILVLFLVPLLFLSILSVKLPHYLTIVYPVYSLAVGIGFYEIINEKMGKMQLSFLGVRRIQVVTLFSIGLIIIQFISIMPYFPYTEVQSNPFISRDNIDYIVGLWTQNDGLDVASQWLEGTAPNSKVLVYGNDDIVNFYAPSLILYGWEAEDQLSKLNIQYIIYSKKNWGGKLLPYYMKNVEPIYIYRVHDVITVYIWKV